MITTNIYLNFNGNCEDAFSFYKSVFGGEFSNISRFEDIPGREESSIPEVDKGKILHVSLPMGKSILMGSDCGSEWAPNFKQGNNFLISVTAESKDEADRLFNGLSTDGHVSMPINDTFWGDYAGMLTDKFGVYWMVSYNAGQA